MELNVDPTIVADVKMPIEDTGQNDGVTHEMANPGNGQS
jgi:hypothetical protein